MPGNEKYLLIIAYLIGLSLGVHLLALLAIFPTLMIVYFKRYQPTLNNFILFVVVAMGAFFVVYPGIVKYLPGMMDGDFMGQRGELIRWIPWILIGGALYGVYRTYKRKQRVAHVALLSIVLIFFGYTTYTTVLIRSNTNPPMNENDPSNLERLTSYLGREQYGNAPTFMPRRWSQEPHQQGIYTEYSSDMDYMFRYQLYHMFARYFFWNYIGQEGDHQDAGVDWKDTLGFPFLIGLVGVYYQFRRDWKMGLVFLSMFIILGPILALYQNQQQPQPRERDYFYVGAFFVFSAWIAIGVVALADEVRKLVQSPQMGANLSAAIIGVSAVVVPINMARVNWNEHDLSGNYVAWDYSYNILQTCEPDAILFTNGDNDTFPLWYLQDVEGIRRDVRIVNLSLVNTSWYIRQMKAEPYYEEAKAVPISFSEAEIEQLQPIRWEPQTVTVPVSRETFERFGVTDTAAIRKGSIEFMMRNTVEFPDGRGGRVRAIRVQDRMVRDIVLTNKWERPIYFAVTVAPDSKIGLDNFLWFHGLAWRLEPRDLPDMERRMDADILAENLLNEPEGFSRTAQYGYKFRNINNPKVHFDENIRRLMMNYRSAFLRLAFHKANVTNDQQGAAAVLDRMENLIPRTKIPMGMELTAYIASFYHRIGRLDKFNELADEVEPVAQRLIEQGRVNFQSFDNPYRILLEIYDLKQEYQKSIELLNKLALQFPNDQSIRQRITMLQMMQQARQDTGNASGGQ
jgi:hypothetical protein